MRRRRSRMAEEEMGTPFEAGGSASLHGVPRFARDDRV
jgi:hypothetical protein